jgi:Ca2+-binding EF-hand superfamily protein
MHLIVEDLEAIFAKMDKNHDGKIEAGEFSDFIKLELSTDDS